MSSHEQETTPFILEKTSRSSSVPRASNEVSGISNDIADHPTTSSRRRISRLLLAISFVAGILVAVSILTILHTKTLRSVSTRLQPHAVEGSDSRTGLPLAWSNGDCGNSAAEALARGCRYSIVLHSWLPPSCLSAEDEEDDRLMYQARSWPFSITTHTSADDAAPQTSTTRNLTLDELRRGDYGHFTTTFDWHVTHCMFVWKRLHRVIMNKDLRLDSYTANFAHTKHCVEMIGGDPGGMKDRGTKIFVKYPVCA